MGRKLIVVDLPVEEQDQLRRLLSKGFHSSRTIRRAHTLLRLHAGEKPTAIAITLDCSPATVKAVKSRYLKSGLERALYDAPRSGAPPKVTTYHEADVTALACSIPPLGRGKWTAELLSDELVKLGYQEGHSPSTVRRILKKVNSNRGKSVSGA